MSKRWIRLYTEIINDPKVQRLSPHLFKTWINLLAIAGTTNGSLPSVDDLSFRLRMSVTDVRSHIDDLILCGLLDLDMGTITPHNWARRQFTWDGADPTNAERQKRHRKRIRKTTRNRRVTDGVTDGVTADVTENDSESVSVSVSVDRKNRQQEVGGTLSTGTLVHSGSYCDERVCGADDEVPQ